MSAPDRIPDVLPNPITVAELGPLKGSFSCMPGIAQICVGMLVLGAFAGLVATIPERGTRLPMLAIGPIAMVVMLLLHRFEKRSTILNSRLRFFESGIEVSTKSKPAVFRYDQIERFTLKEKDFEHNGSYLVTRAELEFAVEDCFRIFRFETDYRRGSKQEQQLIDLHDRCVVGAKVLLSREMEEKGKLQWTPTVSMVMDGLLVQRENETQLIAFEQIEDWQLQGNNWCVWRYGDALPCLSIARSEANFGPIVSLATDLRQCYLNHDQQTVEHASPDVLETDLAEA